MVEYKQQKQRLPLVPTTIAVAAVVPTAIARDGSRDFLQIPWPRLISSAANNAMVDFKSHIILDKISVLNIFYKVTESLTSLSTKISALKNAENSVFLDPHNPKPVRVLQQLVKWQSNASQPHPTRLPRLGILQVVLLLSLRLNRPTIAELIKMENQK